MRDTSSDAAAALDSAVNMGRLLHGEGHRLAAAQEIGARQGLDATGLRTGWLMAAEDALPELVRLRGELQAARATRETERRTLGAIGANALLIREALTAMRPLWNMMRPAKPNPREQRQIAEALALNDRAVAALDAMPPPAPAPAAQSPAPQQDTPTPRKPRTRKPPKRAA